MTRPRRSTMKTRPSGKLLKNIPTRIWSRESHRVCHLPTKAMLRLTLLPTLLPEATSRSTSLNPRLGWAAMAWAYILMACIMVATFPSHSANPTLPTARLRGQPLTASTGARPTLAFSLIKAKVSLPATRD